MSKSKGNVINPDDVVERFGADTLRLYEMFMGPLEQMKPWNTKNILGVRRFLERIWKAGDKVASAAKSVAEPVDVRGFAEEALSGLVHQTVKKVGDDIENLKLNTAISSLMVLLNKFEEQESIPAEQFGTFLKLVAPFAPHLTSELAEEHSIDISTWPTYDESMLSQGTITLGVQVNGKVRGTIEVGRKASKDEAVALALANPLVAKWLPEGALQEGKSGVKVIYVPGRILSFVLSTGA